MKSVKSPFMAGSEARHLNVGWSVATVPSVGKRSFGDASALGCAMERMRTLAAEVCATCASTLLLARHCVSRVVGGMPKALDISFSLTVNSFGPFRTYSLPEAMNITEACD